MRVCNRHKFFNHFISLLSISIIQSTSKLL